MTKAEFRTYMRELIGDRRAPYNLSDATMDINIVAALKNFSTDVGIPRGDLSTVLNLTAGVDTYSLPTGSSGIMAIGNYCQVKAPWWYIDDIPTNSYILNEEYGKVRISPVPTENGTLRVRYWGDYSEQYSSIAEDDPIALPSEFYSCISSYVAYLSHRFRDLDVRNRNTAEAFMQDYRYMMGQARAYVSDILKVEIGAEPDPSYIIDGRTDLYDEYYTRYDRF